MLNACEYGNIPQNRERIYIVGFLNKKNYENFEFPEPVKLEKKVKDVIDFNKKVDEKYYYTKEKYPKIMQKMKDFDDNTTIYQWRRQYVRQNKNHLCPTLTANMGTGGHNVPLVITKFGVRKLTPKECFNLQGFPKNYKLPNIPTSQLYKQAGNSVCVTVIERIARNIKQAIE
ncbi:MAG: DNA (cytosine-5-)-methyltransferase [Lachnospiraceae bacterium]|nr:DNA (cytosine-5-)-methyltransferase [Lachnospiraceae bacterium]